MTSRPTTGAAASGIRRRAVLVGGAGAALAAAAPPAAAGKHKQAPVAFVAMTITRTGFFVSEPNREFIWEYQASVQHPDSSFEDLFTNEAFTPLEATPAQTRAAIVKQVQDLVSQFILPTQNPPVPPERISVVLL